MAKGRRFDPRRTLSSLRSRVFLATAIVAALAFALAVQFVTVRVGRESESELLKGLTEARALVEEHYAERIDNLTLMARLVADLPKLKAAVATQDPPTVLPLAEDYRAQLRCEVLVLHDAEGRELVALGDAAGLLDGGRLTAALEGRELSGFRPRGGELIQLVTVPIVIGPDPPEVLGALSLGFALDDELARRFEAVTQSEVAFFVDGRLLASSLDEPARSRLKSLLSRSFEGISTLSLDDGEYVALAHRLSTNEDGGELDAVILRSRTDQLRLLQAFRTGVVIATVIGMVVAIGLSYGVARTVTKPLAAITDVMREMSATGDLTRKIHLGSGWNDEDATLLARTFNTLTDSIARFQREASVRERFSSLGRMSAVIAHEIRNPLMIIKASLRTLRSPRASLEERREAADDIDHEVRRLDRMVGDVLDFAAPVKIDASPVELDDLCREVAEASMKNDKGPRVSLRLAEGAPRIVTDRERLRTALLNVVGNAMDAVAARYPEGGVAELPEIEVETRLVPPGSVAIVIRDRGTGIPTEDLDRIFEPYFTSKRKGGGLGLAITKNIVESLGGTITAASRAGGPTEMRLELPVECSRLPESSGALARSGRSE